MPFESVRSCEMAPMRLPGREPTHVDVLLGENGNAGFGGLYTCKSVWMCPVCAERIGELRRRELNQLLAWSREIENGRPRGFPIMLTLTARHFRGDRLEDLLSGMKNAKKTLQQSRSWKRFKGHVIGSVTATEVTHGGNGWHVHFHMVVVVRAFSDPLVALLERELPAEWRRALGKNQVEGREGTRALDGNERAFHWQNADAVGSYVAKFGAAEELTLSSRKRGRSSSLTPFQLLAASADGDRSAGYLFQEYATAFKGRCQLVWSPGLKSLCGADQVEAEVEAEREAQPPELVARIPLKIWDYVIPIPGSRTSILEAAELHGEEGVRAALAVLLDTDPPPPRFGRRSSRGPRPDLPKRLL